MITIMTPSWICDLNSLRGPNSHQYRLYHQIMKSIKNELDTELGLITIIQPTVNLTIENNCRTFILYQRNTLELVNFYRENI